MPSTSAPLYETLTASSGWGVSPAPDLMMRYCNPLGSTTTPGFAALAAKYARLAWGLMSPASACDAMPKPRAAMAADIRKPMTNPQPNYRDTFRCPLAFHRPYRVARIVYQPVRTIVR